MERERRALTLKIVPSSFFFCTSHREREHFFLLWFPLQCQKTQQKVLFFFAFFCLCLVSVLPFLFFDLPYKKIITREEGRIFFRRPLFFFVCVFSCLSQQQHKGIAKYLCAKAKKATLFFLGFAQKARKKKRFKKTSQTSRVLSLVFLLEYV